MSPTQTAHIQLDDRGIAWIDDTNVKVIEVVLDKLAHGWSPEEMHSQHPDLSLAQIHAALSYFYDHQEELNPQIESQLQEVERLARIAGQPPLLARLRASGRLP